MILDHKHMKLTTRQKVGVQSEMKRAPRSPNREALCKWPSLEKKGILAFLLFVSELRHKGDSVIDET
jgi:hypothetical protein